MRYITLSLLLSTFCSPSFAALFYLGGLGGYGSTSWAGLVPNSENLNAAINLSTPIDVQEGGGVYGLFTGVEFSPAFAVELSYLHYPDAHIFFDPLSLFSFENNDLTTFDSHTNTLNLMGKIMTPLFHTPLRIYSAAGIATVHRQDMLLDQWHLAPTFGVGFNYHLSEKLITAIDGNYTAGFGESQLNPANTYFPFLYAITFRLAYCLG